MNPEFPVRSRPLEAVSGFFRPGVHAAHLALASRVYIINNGHVAHEGPAQELRTRPELLQRYLGI